MTSLIVAAGERRGSLGVGFENMMRSLGHEMRGPAGTGRGGVSMAGGREGQGARKGDGVRCHRLPSPPWFVQNLQVFRLSVSMRKVGGEHPFCVLIYMNSYMFQICCILFVLLSYLIFDFVCLTLSSAATMQQQRYIYDATATIYIVAV